MFQRGDVVCYERADGGIRYGIFTHLEDNRCFAHWGWTVENATSQSIKRGDNNASWVLVKEAKLYKSMHTPATRLFLD